MGPEASYGPRGSLLAEVDFALPASGVTALLGPAGMSKSTLLRTLAGLNDVNPRFRRWGQVQCKGQPLGTANQPRLVQQHARLMRANTLDALIEMARQGEQNSPAVAPVGHRTTAAIRLLPSWLRCWTARRWSSALCSNVPSPFCAKPGPGPLC